MNDKELLQKAVSIATAVHAEQLDKGGLPYIMHPLRVAEKCSTTDEKVVAILHDTIEDGDISPEYLLHQGFSQQIVDAVVSVTKLKGEDYEAFVKRASLNPIGRIVKIRDIEDNMDIRRLETLDEKAFERLQKYHKAFTYLTKVANIPASEI